MAIVFAIVLYVEFKIKIGQKLFNSILAPPFRTIKCIPVVQFYGGLRKSLQGQALDLTSPIINPSSVTVVHFDDDLVIHETSKAALADNKPRDQFDFVWHKEKPQKQITVTNFLAIDSETCTKRGYLTTNIPQQF